MLREKEREGVGVKERKRREGREECDRKEMKKWKKRGREVALRSLILYFT